MSPGALRGASISYGELNKKANQLARLLRSKGVKPGTVAGIMVERSVAMITGLQAILKAGGAYLPIDPDYPEERIDFMLKDSGAKFLLTDIKVNARRAMKSFCGAFYKKRLPEGPSETFFSFRGPFLIVKEALK